jgi:hypothetical protein
LNEIKTVVWMGTALALSISAVAQAQQDAMPPGHPPVSGRASGSEHGSSTASPSSPMGTSVTGKVIATMDAANYTYVQVDAGTRSVWAAAPRFDVKVGDRVSVPTVSPMQNYRSDTLDRTFPLIYFAGKIEIAGSRSGAAAVASSVASSDRSTPHPSSSRAAPLADDSLKGISKPDGGRTVGEVFDQGKGLAGSEVAIRGRVVKYSPRIMGTNWIHLQDGTRGKDGSNDLVVTTDAVAAVGDLVLVRGMVSADKDFGYGYKYDLIVEGASVTVE